MKTLVLVDKLNWAYHSIAKSLKKHAPHLRFHVKPIKGNVADIKKCYKKYDQFFVMGWQTYDHVKFLPSQSTLTGVHSFHSWDNKKTTPGKPAKPPRDLVDTLSKFKSVNVVSDALHSTFTKAGLKCVYTPNGVDVDIFKSHVSRPIGDSIVVGYSGSKAHDWRKGVTKFIIPAAKKANVKCKLAMLSTNNYVPLEDMHTFYNQVDVYICASLSEGMSLSVLEAASCGCPVITTRCSGCTELIKDGETGFFVNRSVDEIFSRIEQLKDRKLLQQMSRNIADDMRRNWSWETRAKAWSDFIEGC